MENQTLSNEAISKNNDSSSTTIITTTIGNNSWAGSTVAPEELFHGKTWTLLLTFALFGLFFCLFGFFWYWFMKREDPEEGKEEVKLSNADDKRKKCVVDHKKWMRERMAKLRSGQLHVPGAGGVATPVASHVKRSGSKGHAAVPAAAPHVPHAHHRAAPTTDPSIVAQRPPHVAHGSHRGSVPSPGRSRSRSPPPAASGGHVRQVSPSKSSSRPHVAQAGSSSAGSTESGVTPRRSSSRSSSPVSAGGQSTGQGSAGSQSLPRHRSRERLV